MKSTSPSVSPLSLSSSSSSSATKGANSDTRTSSKGGSRPPHQCTHRRSGGVGAGGIHIDPNPASAAAAHHQSTVVVGGRGAESAAAAVAAYADGARSLERVHLDVAAAAAAAAAAASGDSKSMAAFGLIPTYLKDMFLAAHFLRGIGMDTEHMDSAKPPHYAPITHNPFQFFSFANIAHVQCKMAYGIHATYPRP